MNNEFRLTQLDQLLYRFGTREIAKKITIEKFVGYAATYAFGYAFSRSFSTLERSIMTNPHMGAVICLLTSISMNVLRKKVKLDSFIADENGRWDSRCKLVIHHLPILGVAAAILCEAFLTKQPITFFQILRPCAFAMGADMVGNGVKKTTQRFLVG